MSYYKVAPLSNETNAFTAGRKLRDLRDRLGMTLRTVEEASSAVAATYRNDEFIIPPSRLSDIETKGVLPSLYRLHSLAIIYKITWQEILEWYGIDLNVSSVQVNLPPVPRTHISRQTVNMEALQLPTRMDPSFSRNKTSDIARFVQQWGLLPMEYLAKFANDHYVYAYVGMEDYTMYPILMPGAFVQVDQTRNRVQRSISRSDYERPIYFIETHDEYICGWCSVKENRLVVEPHPMSPCEIRIFKTPQEAEVIGQIVGAAMRLAEWHPHGVGPDSAK
jgi:transcriptional regulator with XRE-family HTH domain